MQARTRFLTTLAACGALLLGAAGPGMASDGGKGHGHTGGLGGEHVERMAEKLDLSPEQKSRVDTIVKENSPRLRELRQQLMAKRTLLMEQAKSGYDEAKVKQEAQAVGDLVEEMTVIGTRMGAQVYAVLTPEQQAQLEAHKQERQGQHGSRHHGEHAE